jgi:hypothetical protein
MINDDIDTFTAAISRFDAASNAKAGKRGCANCLTKPQQLNELVSGFPPRRSASRHKPGRAHHHKLDIAGLTPFGLLIADFGNQLFEFAWVLTIGEAVGVFPDQAVICEKIPGCKHRFADRFY